MLVVGEGWGLQNRQGAAPHQKRVAERGSGRRDPQKKPERRAKKWVMMYEEGGFILRSITGRGKRGCQKTVIRKDQKKELGK